MAGHTIVEVSSQSQKAAFIDLPWKIYKKNSYWVPPRKSEVRELLSPKHPFYQNAEMKKWLAYNQKGQVVGRVAAIINHAYNQYHQEKCGHFGLFETIYDPDMACDLLDTAENYLQSRGMNLVQGPVNPSTNYPCGILVKGFQDSPHLMTSYNLPYYCSLLERNGYTKGMDLLAYKMSVKSPLPLIVHRYTEKILKTNHIRWRTLDKNHWEREVEIMHQLYNTTWDQNWGFVPMSREEFQRMTNSIKGLCDEGLILFVEVGGEPAGLIIALPDYNQIYKEIRSGKILPTGIKKIITSSKKINRARVLTLGIKKEYRNTGIALLLYKKIQEQLLKTQQYSEVELSWVMETNRAMNRPLKMMGANPYKTFRIYQKNLGIIT